MRCLIICRQRHDFYQNWADSVPNFLFGTNSKAIGNKVSEGGKTLTFALASVCRLNGC